MVRANLLWNTLSPARTENNQSVTRDLNVTSFDVNSAIRVARASEMDDSLNPFSPHLHGQHPADLSPCAKHAAHERTARPHLVSDLMIGMSRTRGAEN
jgi:hypothetical protein